MCWDLNVADQSWVAPDAERVVGKAAGADDLTVVRTPSEAGDLGSSVDAVDTSTSGGVPEVDVTIIWSTSSSKNVWLPRAPTKCLHCSLVVGLGELGDSQGASIPDGDEVIVATSSKLSTIGAPFKTADFRSVRDELGNLMLSNADIVVED
jgi:hypothetical protein